LDPSLFGSIHSSHGVGFFVDFYASIVYLFEVAAGAFAKALVECADMSEAPVNWCGHRRRIDSIAGG
jgi:hypothetical protein